MKYTQKVKQTSSEVSNLTHLTVNYSQICLKLFKETHLGNKIINQDIFVVWGIFGPQGSILTKRWWRLWPPHVYVGFINNQSETVTRANRTPRKPQITIHPEGFGDSDARMTDTNDALSGLCVCWHKQPQPVSVSWIGTSVNIYHIVNVSVMRAWGDSGAMNQLNESIESVPWP